MRDDVRDAFEEFLVEHVMIGLGNIRASISRIEATELHETEARQLALNRIGAQIDHLEARARSLHGILRHLDTVAQPAFARTSLRDGRPLFQSRRGVN